MSRQDVPDFRDPTRVFCSEGSLWRGRLVAPSTGVPGLSTLTRRFSTKGERFMTEIVGISLQAGHMRNLDYLLMHSFPAPFRYGC